MVNEAAFDRGPLTRIPGELRQAALDAAALLQVRRSELAGHLANGEPCGASIVASGSHDDINEWMREDSRRWRELLSVRTTGFLPHLRVTFPQNRVLIANGLRMVSLFHIDGLDPEARRMVAGEQQGRYLLGIAPVQMKIVDRRYVLLHGPYAGGEGSVMAVTAPDCLAAAWRYWHAAVAASYPAEVELGDDPQLTPRQRQVVALLADDTRDEAIAEALGVSVRTVRADIAEIMVGLGVRSRFAAGVRARGLVRDW